MINTVIKDELKDMKYEKWWEKMRSNEHRKHSPHSTSSVGVTLIYRLVMSQKSVATTTPTITQSTNTTQNKNLTKPKK